jgi:hypothetical protein
MPYSTLREKQNELIRKARDGSVFIAPMSTVNLASLTTGSSSALATLPTGWEDLGWTSTDGVSYGRESDTSDVQAFGSQEPVRSDIVSDTITMEVTALETKLQTLGLYIGVDTTGIKAAVTTAELRIAKPQRAANYHYRVLGLFVDEIEEGEIYIGRYMPRAKITDRAEQVYSSGDDPIQYGFTFTGYEDSTAGTSHEWLFGGPGWKALLTKMGITQAVAP